MASTPSPESATTALYRAALGPVNPGFYLPVFARFDELGLPRPSWNTAAALLTLNWLLFRRLWGRAVLYVLLLGSVVGLAWLTRPMWQAWPGGVTAGLAAFVCVLAMAIPGFYGNAWLHADVRSRMTLAVQQARTVQEACERLGASASSRRWGLSLCLINAALAVALVLWWRPATVPVADSPPVLASSASGSLVVAEPVASPAPVIPPAVPVPVPAPEPVAELPEPEPVPVTAPIPVPATVLPPAPPQPAASVQEAVRPRVRGHGVNVGLFASEANAQRVLDQLRLSGLPVLVDEVESARGTLLRVRVGPFDERAGAEAAAARVRALGLEARVYAP